MSSRKINIIKGKKSDKRVADLRKIGFEVKMVTMPNGDTIVLKRRKLYKNKDTCGKF